MNLGESGMEAFQYTALPARVLFGFGTIEQVADELVSLGRKRAFVLSDPHHARTAAARLMRALGELGVHLSTDAVMHTPVGVTERVMETLVACHADCIIAIGGGSTIGLAKALALRTDLPQIVLPTTYAGSEATPVLGETREGQKSTIRSMKVLPEVIVYDVDLTLGLPPRISMVSGINAIAHAVEALYAKDDAVFGVKPSLILRPRRKEGVNTVEYGFGLADERESTRSQVEALRRELK